MKPPEREGLMTSRPLSQRGQARGSAAPLPSTPPPAAAPAPCKPVPRVEGRCSRAVGDAGGSSLLLLLLLLVLLLLWLVLLSLLPLVGRVEAGGPSLVVTVQLAASPASEFTRVSGCCGGGCRAGGGGGVGERSGGKSHGARTWSSMSYTSRCLTGAMPATVRWKGPQNPPSTPFQEAEPPARKDPGRGNAGAHSGCV